MVGEVVGASKQRIRPIHRWMVFQMPDRVSSPSRQAALASMWPTPIVADSGRVKKEGVSRNLKT